MAKGSDNPFPSVLVVEGTTPTSPGAGDQRIFIDSADHKFKRVNSSGTVTTIEGASASFIGSRVSNSTTQSLTNNTQTTLTCDTEAYDTDTMHDTVSNTSRITATTAGYYIFTASVIFAANNTGVRWIRFKQNGTSLLDMAEVEAVQGDLTGLCITMPFHMNATDYMEIIALQTSGGALNAQVLGFSATKVG